MILQVHIPRDLQTDFSYLRIPKGLQTHFSYVHTLKGFPVVVANGASWCKTALGLQSFWRV